MGLKFDSMKHAVHFTIPPNGIKRNRVSNPECDSSVTAHKSSDLDQWFVMLFPLRIRKNLAFLFVKRGVGGGGWGGVEPYLLLRRIGGGTN
ncbi:hypothetical protein TNCV_1205991 [Trichonephila clavipes]|nr:hypothetical protein TNCV_1205991 [Trichonephila clavipes]